MTAKGLLLYTVHFYTHRVELAAIWCSGPHLLTVWKLWHDKAVCLSNTSPDLFSFITAGSLCVFREDGGTED